VGILGLWWRDGFRSALTLRPLRRRTGRVSGWMGVRGEGRGKWYLYIVYDSCDAGVVEGEVNPARLG